MTSFVETSPTLDGRKCPELAEGLHEVFSHSKSIFLSLYLYCLRLGPLDLFNPLAATSNFPVHELIDTFLCAHFSFAPPIDKPTTPHKKFIGGTIIAFTAQGPRLTDLGQDTGTRTYETMKRQTQTSEKLILGPNRGQHEKYQTASIQSFNG